MKKPSVVLGIDPGKNGGLVVLSKKHGIMSLNVMPLVGREINTQELSEIIKKARFDFKADCAVIEQVHSMPGQGLVSTFSFGKGFGLLIGQITMLGMPLYFVRPQQWQKGFHDKTNSKTPKDRSLDAAKLLWPSEDFLPTSRHKVAHDGLVDAALIAQWGIDSL